MLIVSQNKEKVLWFGRAFNALEYSEQVNHKGKKETVRHTICISWLSGRDCRVSDKGTVLAGAERFLRSI